MKILYHHRTRATDAQKVHILEMVEAFRELGHPVTVASLVETERRSANPEREAQEPSSKKFVRRVPLASEVIQLAYNLIGIPWLVYRIYRTGADLVYERYSLLNFSGVVAAALTGRKIVLEVNAPLALELGRENEIRAHKFAGWMERVICNSATKVVVVSGPLRKIMMQNGVRASKLCLLPNGVNLRRFGSASIAGPRVSLDIRGRAVIGFVGWFRPWHGVEFLLDAFFRSGLSASKALLLLVGDGPSMPQLLEYVEQHGLQNSVIFSGPVSHQRVPYYLDLFDIAVQPAANEYCCPMKILEYMGLAKAIIAPRQENILELLEDGRSAAFFRPGDAESLSSALVRLTTDSALRSKLGGEALRTIHERGLRWESNAAKIVEMVQPRRGALAAPCETNRV